MKITRKRIVCAVAVAAATLFALFPTSCYQYVLYGAVDSFNFCTVLNCQQGSFFSLCGSSVLLVDCPTTTAP